MPNSPINPTSPAQNDPNSNTQKRICDFCGELEALLYCRADSAKLCLSCDREVHSTNQLFTKHTRFQLCDSCDSSPATIFCCTEHSVLCQNCDYEFHNQPRSSGNHDRRPLEGFTGRPSVSEIAAAVGFEGFDCKSLLIEDEVTDQGFGGGGGGGGGLLGGFEEEDDGFCEFFVWDTPAAMVTLDDLIVTTDKSHNFHAMGMPPLPKDRNLSCGQHKHEILRQLRELAKLEPTIKEGLDPLIDYHFEADENQDFKVQCQVPAYKHEEHSIFLGNEARTYNWGNDEIEAVHDVFLSPSSQSHIEESFLNTDTKSGISSSVNLPTTGQNSQFPVGSDSVSVAPKVPSHEFTPADRDSALSRYKEKKRTRRFEKHIRYESRKVQAENRIRIRGRFAKIDNRVV